MKLTKITEYALAILPHMVKADKPIKLTEIVERTGVPMTYAGIILPRLRTAGMVNATRGRHGGYVLAIPPESLDIVVLIETLEGESFFVPNHKPMYLIHAGTVLARAIRSVSLTLADLMKNM